MWQRLKHYWKQFNSDESFLDFMHDLERMISKVLSIAMLIVILVSVADLILLLVRELTTPPIGLFSQDLITIFGVFLNVLIALEILENITAYLRKQVIQVELVIVTALIAAARKVIIFDFSEATSLDLLSLGAAILALSIAYWIVHSRQSRIPKD